MELFLHRLPKKRLLAISIGICYLWFGVLKFFPGLSPADSLAKETITVLTFGYLSASTSIVILAIWEVALGLALILQLYIRQVVLLTLVHMLCTFTPLLFFPDLSFNEAPFSLTLVGQYIMKNLVIISALLMLYPGNPPVLETKNQSS